MKIIRYNDYIGESLSKELLDSAKKGIESLENMLTVFKDDGLTYDIFHEGDILTPSLTIYLYKSNSTEKDYTKNTLSMLTDMENSIKFLKEEIPNLIINLEEFYDIDIVSYEGSEITFDLNIKI